MPDSSRDEPHDSLESSLTPSREVEEIISVLRQTEPRLDDVTQARIHAKVRAAIERRKTNWTAIRKRALVGWGVAAVTVLGVGFLGVWTIRNRQKPESRHLVSRRVPATLARAQTMRSNTEEGRQASGSTPILRPYIVSGKVSPVHARRLLGRQVDRLKVSAGVTITSELGLRDHVSLTGPGLLHVGSATRERIALSLGCGRLLVEHDHASGQKLVVKTDDVKVTVTGTLFLVEAPCSAGGGSAYAGPTKVGVARGSVDIRAKTSTAQLGFGQMWRSDYTQPNPLPDAVADALADHGAILKPAAGAVGQLSVLQSKAGDRVWFGKRFLGSPPIRAHVPTGKATLRVVRGDGSERIWAADIRPYKEHVHGAQLEMVSEPKERGTPPRPNLLQRDTSRRVARLTAAEPESASACYERAERAMRKGDVDAAEMALQMLVTVHPDDPLTPLALYEIARLRFAMGDLLGARRHLVRFAREKPTDSPIADPVHYLRCRVEFAARRREAAEACLRAFRTTFPLSPHAPEVLALLGIVRADMNRCSAALPLLDEYVGQFPNGPLAQAVTQRRRRCTPAAIPSRRGGRH